jgi:ATP adenylyltransferase
MNAPTGLNADHKRCRFCSYLDGRQVDTPANTPWLADANYGALISIGALVPGWTLVCPKQHETNLCSHYANQDFWRFTQSAAEHLKRLYGDVRIFEHGASHEGSATGCGTDHAHLHIVPLGFSLTQLAQISSDALTWQECAAKDIPQVVDKSEYLFVSDNLNGKNTSGLVAKLNMPVSQYFRRIIAKQLKKPELYDYKAHPMGDLTNQFATEMHEHMHQCSTFEIA